jgi:anaerobic selenocysteine-containing dehydrogenase
MVPPKVILTGKPYPVKMMVVTASNMLRSLPNTHKQRQALESLDFLAVMDVYMTETSQLADIVLPAATFLERTEPIFSYYPVLENVSYIMLRKKVMQYEECRSDGEFWLELAKKMGYQEHFPWKDLEELYDFFLKPSGSSVNQLREEKPGGVMWSNMEYKRYKKHGLRTPSGKIEIYSSILEQMGLPPLPTYIEPVESPARTPELAKEYPLVLTTGARELPFIHSQLHNLPKLRKLRPEPTAEIHPNTASKYGIQNGQMMTIETTRGATEIKAEVTEDIIPDVVCIPHAWAEVNANCLTDEKPADAAVGNPALKALLCKVSGKA